MNGETAFSVWVLSVSFLCLAMLIVYDYFSRFMGSFMFMMSVLTTTIKTMNTAM